MPDSGNLTQGGHSVNYVFDALRERLPANYTLARSEGASIDGSGTPSAFYRWTRWPDETQMLIEVHEAYANRLTVDELCDKVMDAVLESFQDPLAKFTSPRWKRGLATLPEGVMNA